MNQQSTAVAPIVEFKRNLTALIESKELPLPSNVSVEAFRNAAIVAAQDNPQILLCDRESVFKSVRTLAAAGLVPDGREAAMVPFKTRVNGEYVSKCQAMPMVFGLIKMVRRSGTVTDIRAHIVFQNEVDQGRFEYVVGDEESLTHSPILFGDKGDPVAAYAIARLKDGGIVREFMGADEIDTVRRSSSAQKVFEKGKPPRVSDEPIGIWKDWTFEMWKKTVIRRLCKRLDMSSEDMRRVMVEQDQENIRDITPADVPKTRLQRMVQEARGEAPQESEALSGEVLPDEAETLPPAQEITAKNEDEAQTHWTDGLTEFPGFPGSQAWDEGVAAAKAGRPMSSIPYAQGSGEADDWLAGYDGQRRAQE